jgi:hypothetical protein
MYKYYDIIDKERLELKQNLYKIDAAYRKKQRIIIIAGIFLLMGTVIIFNYLLVK